MAMKWIDDKEIRAEVANEMASKDRRSGWLEDIYTGIIGEEETLGSVQQWHAEGPKRERPSKAKHRKHAGAAVGKETMMAGPMTRWQHEEKRLAMAKTD
ncbi:hypothetical protein E2562_018771 [Oryza meyeriana var. granulata]|uniref:Uncharacterized protein n=1 Tax=Oryza meyeriana var. granulata TaxID=110450 RepID=A0A6G1EX72_9ORYZ|nr:hypothetical protein E2562_018771 [Oryza meyeriana var. granulata]